MKPGAKRIIRFTILVIASLLIGGYINIVLSNTITGGIHDATEGQSYSHTHYRPMGWPLKSGSYYFSEEEASTPGGCRQLGKRLNHCGYSSDATPLLGVKVAWSQTNVDQELGCVMSYPLCYYAPDYFTIPWVIDWIFWSVIVFVLLFGLYHLFGWWSRFTDRLVGKKPRNGGEPMELKKPKEE